MPSPTQPAPFLQHLPLFCYEALELALFMLSATLVDILLYHPHFAPIHNPWLTRACMGAGMGLTAILLIKSPFGIRSGAHFNPAVTLTFLRLGKIDSTDALFYILFQFAGGILGVYLAALLVPHYIAAPQVDYIVTVPGIGGPVAAFAAETFMSAVLMLTVLITSNNPRLSPYTTYCMGLLIASDVLFFAPISGFSMNPARTLGSAVPAHVYTALWIYFTAPILGMLTVAELYLRQTKPHKHPRHHPWFHHRHLTQHP